MQTCRNALMIWILLILLLVPDQSSAQKLPDQSPCTKASDCVSSRCSARTKLCCKSASNGMPSRCTANADCCSNRCGANGRCEKPPVCTLTRRIESCNIFSSCSTCNQYCDGNTQFKSLPVTIPCIYEPGAGGCVAFVNKEVYKCARKLVDETAPCNQFNPDIGKSCILDDNCAGCLQCCRKWKICELSPFAAHIQPMLNDLNEYDVNHNKYDFIGNQTFGYIFLIGFVLIILVNSVFIAYWCLFKRYENKSKSEKCDIVADNEDELICE